jgi:hypothetical protein
MPEFLTHVVTGGLAVAPLDVLFRLLVAFAYGLVIAFVYRWTRGAHAPATTFPMTLLLLCVLIAMVTQVIGDNIARAFSLVGALSIVRFRTVVRDTQDTAYVILAVIVGMAVGAWSLWVATIGIAVVTLAEVVFLYGGVRSKPIAVELQMKVRVAAAMELDELVGEALGSMLEKRELLSLAMVKQGESLEGNYVLVPKPGVSMPELVRALGGRAGVQNVQVGKLDDAG